MNRRGFFGLLAAAVVAPAALWRLVKRPALVRSTLKYSDLSGDEKEMFHGMVSKLAAHRKRSQAEFLEEAERVVREMT